MLVIRSSVGCGDQAEMRSLMPRLQNYLVFTAACYGQGAGRVAEWGEGWRGRAPCILIDMLSLELEHQNKRYTLKRHKNNNNATCNQSSRAFLKNCTDCNHCGPQYIWEEIVNSQKKKIPLWKMVNIKCNTTMTSYTECNDIELFILF